MNPLFSDRPAFRAALAAAARELDADVREGPGEGWTVAGGTLACGNPNGSRWNAVATLGEGVWTLDPVPVAMPWNRRRAGEIAAVRVRQLDDLLRNPRKAEPHVRSPFTAGPSLAGRAQAFAWIVAAGALAMAMTLAVATLLAVPIIDREIARLGQAAEVLSRIGADPLPRPAEMENLGWMGRLASAFLLATPVAFFLGGLHAAVFGAGSRFLVIARFAPWALVFIGASTLLAWAPRTAIPFTALAALLMPAAAFLGTSVLWGRRRDVVQEVAVLGRRTWIPWAVSIVVVVVLIAVLVPAPSDNDRRIHETSRFRDRFLLGTSAGRALAHFYYRYTLYAAEPVRPAYTTDANLRDRQIRTALLVGQFGLETEMIRAMGFSVEAVRDSAAAAPLIAKRQHDIYLVSATLTPALEKLDENDLLGRTVIQGSATGRTAAPAATLPAPAMQEQIQKTFDQVLRVGGVEAMLLELTWLGWTAVFYAGPLFILLLVAAPLAALLGWLARHRSPRAVRRVVFGVFAGSTALLIAIFIGQFGALGRLAALKHLPTDDQQAIDALAAGLKDPDPNVRYEAAYRAYMTMRSKTSFPRGGLTAELRAGAKDDSVRVRLWCASALGLTRDPAVRPDILRAMDDPDMLVRYRAAEGLEHLDGRRTPPPPETIRRLREMMRTRSWYEGMYALDALRQIDPLKY
jgi:hypothetical protein